MHLRDLLIDGVNREKIICPMPYETLLESSTCDIAKTRTSIFELFIQISNGRIFRQYFDVLTDELLALVRPSHIVYYFEVTERMEEMSELSARFKPEFCEMKSEKNAELGSWIDPGSHVVRTNDEVLKSVSLEPVAKLWRDLRRIAKVQDSDASSEFECGGITEKLQAKGLTAFEALELSDALLNRKMEAIPFQFYHNRLAAAGSQEAPNRVNRNVTHNDIVDQERMSVALFLADMAVTDNRMVARIVRSRVLEFTTCKVFKVGEMRDFQLAIERILGGSHAS